MLSNNLKRIRKSKGLSQEELAIKLNIVRQTVSKWENGLSVPDSDMLITLADELDTSVSVLLGETVMEPMTDDLKAISEKLEVITIPIIEAMKASGANLTKTNSNPCNIVPATANSGLL